MWIYCCTCCWQQLHLLLATITLVVGSGVLEYYIPTHFVEQGNAQVGPLLHLLLATVALVVGSSCTCYGFQFVGSHYPNTSPYINVFVLNI